MNSYLLMSHENSVAVCLCHPAGRYVLILKDELEYIETIDLFYTHTHTPTPLYSEIVYPDPSHKELSDDDPRLSTGKYEPLVHIDGVLTDKVQRVMESHATSPPASVPSSSLLSGALSRCLCCILLIASLSLSLPLSLSSSPASLFRIPLTNHCADIHRCTREAPVGRKLQSRILVIRSSIDSASQYISTMNCIFAAQKNVSTSNWPFESCYTISLSLSLSLSLPPPLSLPASTCIQNVPIDSCVLWQDSGFLQQVCKMTNPMHTFDH